MPSFAASFGPWMWTCRPSKRISPWSGVCVPATHLISVDFPAPLSPTSDMTSPDRTSKSTSLRACTEPNDFVMPRSWRSGVSSTWGFPTTPAGWRRRATPPPRGGGGARAPPPPGELVLLAVLLVLPGADLALLQEPVREEPLVVRLGDP